MSATMSEDAAARYIQGLFRTRKARANLARMIGCIYEAVWDEDQQPVKRKRVVAQLRPGFSLSLSAPLTHDRAYYYYNTKTGASAWTKPAFAREEDIFTPRARAAAEAKEQKRSEGTLKTASTMTEDEAAKTIQGLWKTRKARKYLRVLIASLYEKVYDESSGTFYYYNTRTGESMWDKPKSMGTEDLAVTPRSKAMAAQRSLMVTDVQGYEQAQPGAAVVVGDWEQHEDDAGNKYYYNSATGASTYDAPPEMWHIVEEQQAQAEAQGGYAADGGGEYKDAGAAAEGYYAEDGTWVATPAEGREAKEGDEGAAAAAAAEGEGGAAEAAAEAGAEAEAEAAPAAPELTEEEIAAAKEAALDLAEADAIAADIAAMTAPAEEKTESELAEEERKRQEEMHEARDAAFEIALEMEREKLARLEAAKAAHREHPPLPEFLERYELLDFQERFVEEGFDATEALLEIKKYDMVEMELGPDDRLRIMKALKAYKDEGTQLLEDRKRALDEEKEEEEERLRKAKEDELDAALSGDSDDDYEETGSVEEEEVTHEELEGAAEGEGQLIGVKIERLFPGDGESFPIKGHFARVHYKGMLEDGSVFENSRARGRPFEFQVGAGHVVPGFDKAVARMTNGERARLVVDPEMAYGEKGRVPVIPPNSTVTFEVELITSYEGAVGDEIWDFDETDDEEEEDVQ